MKRAYKLLICLIVMFVAGCNQPTVRPHIQNTRLFDTPYDETWTAVVESFADKSYPIRAIEKESGFIAVDWIALPDASYESKAFSKIALVPDKSFMLIWRQGRHTINAFVKPKGDDMTEVRINTHIEIFESNMSNRYHVGYSTGFIENAILGRIGTKIKSIRLNL